MVGSILFKALLGAAFLLPTGGDDESSQSPATAKKLPQTQQEIEQVVAELGVDDRVRQEQAAAVLRRLPPDRVGPLVVAYLESKEPRTRRLALRLLRNLGHDRAASRITRMLHSDPDRLVRCEASHAIAALHADRAVDILSNVAHGDLDVKVRRAAILDLGEIRSPAALDALIDVLEEVIAAQDDYLIDITHRALTYCSGRRLGEENVEGWRHFARTFEGYPTGKDTEKHGDDGTADAEARAEAEEEGAENG